MNIICAARETLRKQAGEFWQNGKNQAGSDAWAAAMELKWADRQAQLARAERHYPNQGKEVWNLNFGSPVPWAGVPGSEPINSVSELVGLCEQYGMTPPGPEWDAICAEQDAKQAAWEAADKEATLVEQLEAVSKSIRDLNPSAAIMARQAVDSALGNVNKEAV